MTGCLVSLACAGLLSVSTFMALAGRYDVATYLVLVAISGYLAIIAENTRRPPQ